MSRSDDIEKLLELVDGSITLIDYTIINHKKYFIDEFSADDDFIELLRHAWKDALNTANEAKMMIGDYALWDKFRQSGLTGVQLHFKYVLFKKLTNRAHHNGEIKWFRRLFGFINEFLKSLSTVIPPFEVLKELKGSLEQIVR